MTPKQIYQSEVKKFMKRKENTPEDCEAMLRACDGYMSELSLENIGTIKAYNRAASDLKKRRSEIFTKVEIHYF